MNRTYRIGVIPGDGIGPEVVREGLKVLQSAAQVAGFQYELIEYPWSGRHYLATREIMPESILEEYHQLDALYLGALGDPRVERGLIERSVILAIRFGLDLTLISVPSCCMPSISLRSRMSIPPTWTWWWYARTQRTRTLAWAG